MKIDQLKTMFELQALQNFSATNNNSNSTQVFQELLGSLMSSNQTSTNLIEENTLGSSITSPLLTNNTSLMPINLTKISSNSNTDYEEIISEASTKYNVPEKLIHSVIQIESNYNSNATSYAGASGLMQLMPTTARSLGVQDVFDPSDNIMGGTKYLSQLLTKYEGNIELTLAAYNAGPGNVEKYGGVPPFKETENYVEKVKTQYLT